MHGAGATRIVSTFSAVVLTLALLPRLRGRGPVLDDIGVGLAAGAAVLAAAARSAFPRRAGRAPHGSLARCGRRRGAWPRARAGPRDRGVTWRRVMRTLRRRSRSRRRRTSGVTARRLVFAAAATWLFAAVFGFGSLGARVAGLAASRPRQPFLAAARLALLLPGVQHAAAAARRLAADRGGEVPERTAGRWMPKTAARTAGRSAACRSRAASATRSSLVALRGPASGRGRSRRASHDRSVARRPRAHAGQESGRHGGPRRPGRVGCDRSSAAQLAGRARRARHARARRADRDRHAHTWGVVLVVPAARLALSRGRSAAARAARTLRGDGARSRAPRAPSGASASARRPIAGCAKSSRAWA